MKQLITKSDGTPTKSKVHAIKFLQEKGISEDCLIQENGQFFYEEGKEPAVFVRQCLTYYFFHKGTDSQLAGPEPEAKSLSNNIITENEQNLNPLLWCNTY